jgi:elongation factor P
MLIQMGDDLLRVVELHHVTPGNKRGHVQSKLRDVRNGRMLDHKFRSEDSIERAVLDEREMQYLYRDDDQFYFMDLSTYEQIQMSADTLGDNAQYLLPESVINVEFWESEPLGIHLPLSVDLKVTDTVPGIKGATASAQVKPATLETGLVINVPAFINTDDVVRVNTETGEYLSRV